MRFLFLNQYGPPDPVPTARLLSELADGLRAAGHTVEIVSQSQSYQGRLSQDGRLKRELLASWAILRAGWNGRGGKPDVVLALSSPPGLLVIGALLAWRHRARLVHWAMDLYPELALVLLEISKRSPVAWIVQGIMRWAYRQALLVVALDEDMQAHLQTFCRTTVRVIEPWPAREVERQANEEMARTGAEKVAAHESLGPWVWLYSGNLGRAHEWQTLLEAQSVLEARGLPIQLVFQGDGAERSPAMAYAEKLSLRQCEWRGYVSEKELLPALLRAKVLVVTQRPETRGLLWPSKLALLERLLRPILFVGPADGAIAARLKARGNAGVFSLGQVDAVARWIEDVFHGKISGEIWPSHPWATVTEQAGLLQCWLIECGDVSLLR